MNMLPRQERLNGCLPGLLKIKEEFDKPDAMVQDLRDQARDHLVELGFMAEEDVNIRDVGFYPPRRSSGRSPRGPNQAHLYAQDA